MSRIIAVKPVWKDHVFAIDFDGTIVEHMFPDIGPFVPYAIPVLRLFKLSGAKLVLWTVRSQHWDLIEARRACEAEGIEFDGINKYEPSGSMGPKVHAQVFIDDRGYNCPLIKATQSSEPMVDWLHIAENMLEFEHGVSEYYDHYMPRILEAFLEQNPIKKDVE